MREVTLCAACTTFASSQGYLAHQNPPPPPLGPPQGLRHSPTVGCWGGAISYEQGSPVHARLFTSNDAAQVLCKVTPVILHGV